MRHMMLRSNPLSLFDELLQPYKYGPRMYDNDVGTEEDPSIIVRSEMVQKKYYLDEKVMDHTHHSHFFATMFLRLLL